MLLYCPGYVKKNYNDNDNDIDNDIDNDNDNDNDNDKLQYLQKSLIFQNMKNILPQNMPCCYAYSGFYTLGFYNVWLPFNKPMHCWEPSNILHILLFGKIYINKNHYLDVL